MEKQRHANQSDLVAAILRAEQSHFPIRSLS